MNDAIFLIADQGLVEMKESTFKSEDLLQTFIAQYPALLAGGQITPSKPRRWLLVSRETPIPFQEGGGGRWSLDHLFLDQDGVPTLIEVKRSTDTRIRREVVGQMLDYAANAVLYWPVQNIEAEFIARCKRFELDPDLEIEKFLEDSSDPASFWLQVKTNIEAERIRMIFVADFIPPELQRIIEFLNGQMNPAEVLGVEIKQYTGKELRTLVPRVIGKTADADRIKTSGPPKQWDEDSFYREMEMQVGKDACILARKIQDWAHENKLGDLYGKGRTYGTYYPVYEWNNKKHRLFCLYTSARIEFGFGSFPVSSSEIKIQFQRKLNMIDGVHISEEAVSTWGGFQITLFQDRQKLNAFFEVMAWAIEKITSGK